MDMLLPRRMRERELPRGRMRRVVEAGLKAVERQLGEELFCWNDPRSVSGREKE